MSASSMDGYAVSREELKRIWSVDPARMERFLNELFPHKKTRRTGEGEQTKISMQCPFHDDATPSAALVYEHRTFKCFSSGCERTGHDLVRLLAEASKTPYATMYTQLTRGLGLKPKRAVEEYVKEYTHVQQVMTAFVEAASARLVRAAKHPNDPAYSLEQDILAYNKARNIDAARLAANRFIGAVPTLAEVYACLPPNSSHLLPIIQRLFGASFFSQNPNKLGSYGGYIVFPYHTEPDVYGKVKLRNVPPPGEKARSVWFGKGLRQGFYGLPFYRALYAQTSSLMAYDAFLVEGEYDALASYTYQYQHGNIATPTFAVSGSGADELSTLYALGVRSFVFVPDYDRGGREFVRRGLTELSGRFTARVFDWASTMGPGVVGSDPHDMLLGARSSTYGVTFYNALIDPSVQQTAYDWSLTSIDEEIEVFADAHGRDPQSRELGALIEPYVETVHSVKERGLLVDDLSTRLNLPANRLRAYITREVVDDESFGVVLLDRISSALKPLFIEHGDTVCYLEEHNRLVHLSTKRHDAEATLAEALGPDLFYWARREVGLPPNITTQESSRGRDKETPIHQQRNLAISRLIEVARNGLRHLAGQNMSTHTVRRRGQGVHFLRDMEKAYCVNGAKVWRCDFSAAARTFEWEPVEHIYDADNAILFETHRDEPWTREALDPTKLRPVPMQEARGLYADLVKWFSAWSYDGDLSLYAQFMASYTLCVTFGVAFDTAPSLFVYGRTQAGKSTMTLGALSPGGVMPDYHLLTHSYGMTEYSGASVWQRMAGNPRCAILDEFESETDSHKGNVVHSLLEKLRDASRGTTVSRGTRHGTPVTYELHAPLVLSGIKPLRRIQDANRFLSIPLLPSVAPPAKTIQKVFTVEDAERMRDATTRFALTNAASVLVAYRDIKAELRETPIDVEEHRALQMVLGPAAVRRYLGLEWREFSRKFVLAHEKALELRTAPPELQVFRDTVRLPYVYYRSDNRAVSLRQILNQRSLLLELNDMTSAGVYYYAGLDAFILDPIVVRSKLSRSDRSYSSMDPIEFASLLRGHSAVHSCADLGRADQQQIRTELGRQAILEFLVIPFTEVLDTRETDDADITY